MKVDVNYHQRKISLMSNLSGNIVKISETSELTVAFLMLNFLVLLEQDLSDCISHTEKLYIYLRNCPCRKQADPTVWVAQTKLNPTNFFFQCIVKLIMMTFLF